MLMKALQSNMATVQEHVSLFWRSKFQVLLGKHFSAYHTNFLAQLRSALYIECTLAVRTLDGLYMLGIGPSHPAKIEELHPKPFLKS